MRPKDPVDNEAPWISADGEISVPSHHVAAEMQVIGQQLAILQLGKYKNIEYVWHFLPIENYTSSLVPAFFGTEQDAHEPKNAPLKSI